MLAYKTEVSDTWHHAGGFYRDRRLEDAGIRHGVTTRALGNMKDADCRQKALEAAGLGSAKACLLKQVHGTTVLKAGDGMPASEGDGWIAVEEAYVPCVYVADCLPIYVWDRASKTAVGVFHAGWRGLAGGMAGEAARAFEDYGIKPNRLAASVGPHIGACCYRVGSEVARRFRPDSIVREGFIDLGAEARLQLVDAGLDPQDIAVSQACTSCLSDIFSPTAGKKWING